MAAQTSAKYKVLREPRKKLAAWTGLHNVVEKTAKAFGGEDDDDEVRLKEASTTHKGLPKKDRLVLREKRLKRSTYVEAESVRERDVAGEKDPVEPHGTIIIDAGRYQTRCGVPGEREPRVVLSSVVGRGAEW